MTSNHHITNTKSGRTGGLRYVGLETPQPWYVFFIFFIYTNSSFRLRLNHYDDDDRPLQLLKRPFSHSDMPSHLDASHPMTRWVTMEAAEAGMFFFSLSFSYTSTMSNSRKGITCREWVQRRRAATIPTTPSPTALKKKTKGASRCDDVSRAPQVCFILFTCREWERRLASTIKSPNRAQDAMCLRYVFISLSFFSDYCCLWTLPPTPTANQDGRGCIFW